MDLTLPPLKDEHLVKIALKAAIEAGEEIMSIYGTNFSSSVKSDRSPITKADLASNKIIKEILQQTDHPILSEEEKDDRSRLDKTMLWIVDPLDGTADFIDRTGEFTVMIALVQNKKPILGIINWPSGKEIYLAQKGMGAFKFGENSWQRISVSNFNNLKEARCVVSRNHLSDKEQKLIQKIGIQNFTQVGSSLKIAKISSGEADLYFTFTNKMKEWDSCASNCILSEAGGIMTDMTGKELSYNNENVNHEHGILATNGSLHNQFMKTLKQN